MASKSIVLDANIVIRAVLGERVRNLIIRHYQTVDFFVPDVCLTDAYKYLPQLFNKRNMPSDVAIALLDQFKLILNVVDSEIYEQHAGEAKERMKDRNIDDWPIVASALVLERKCRAKRPTYAC